VPRPKAPAGPRVAPETGSALRDGSTPGVPASPASSPAAAHAAPRTPTPEPAPARTTPRAPRTDRFDQEPAASWEERLGPTGVAIAAVVLCVLAWLLTWKLF